MSIAREVGCDAATVWRYLKRFGIPRRSKIEALKKKRAVETEEEKMKRREEMLKKADKLIAEGRALLKQSRLSPTDRERLRLKEGYERKKKDLEKLRQKIEEENRRDGGAWTVGTHKEWLDDVMYDSGEKI